MRLRRRRGRIWRARPPTRAWTCPSTPRPPPATLAGPHVAPASPAPPSLADDEPAPSSPDAAATTSRKRRRSSGVGLRWAMAVSDCGDAQDWHGQHASAAGRAGEGVLRHAVGHPEARGRSGEGRVDGEGPADVQPEDEAANVQRRGREDERPAQDGERQAGEAAGQGVESQEAPHH
ncbi:hypothetical protein ZWY2020_014223 [Hordeum vulgare]|nr:hypothetical protein ZWY2020_014223 [Hordeum vulgare]